MNPKTRITLEDIANQAGVSTAAVSQALSGKGTLSHATRERILQVVEELSYQPDQVAQSLALRRTSLAGGKRLSKARVKRIPPPEIMSFYNLPELVEVVHLEIQQRDEEGFAVDPYREQLNSWKKPSKQKLYQLYSDVLSAPLRSDPVYHEPDTLDEIQKARSEGPRNTHFSLTSNALLDHVQGAWLGRIAGSVFGKPLQSGYAKSQIKHYLQAANSFPLSNYVPRLVPPPADFDIKSEASGNFLGEIHGAPADDDTDFTFLALHILETYGLDFKTTDVATEWLTHIPYFGTFTTERAIYRNLIWNIHPDEAASFVNPEREFIGARTRADLYGYIAPGNPELAASLAFKDAVLSHTRNGVYSAMMIAAMISWAFVTDNVQEIVRVGLSEIPSHSRLAEAIQDGLTAFQYNDDWELAYESLILKYGSYSPIHTINNTLWVVLALLFGEGDFTRAFSTALTCGMDTGSNTASLGSIMGMILSSSRLPSQWIEPLEDTLYISLAHFSSMRISDLAQRTARLAEKTLTHSND